MLLFRSFAIGLLGACFWILATRPIAIVVRPSIAVESPRPMRFEVPNFSGMRGALPASDAPPTIVDIAPGVSSAQLPALVHLSEGEHVASVDGVPAVSDLDAGRLLANVSSAAHHYADLAVTGPASERRVLVLLH